MRINQLLNDHPDLNSLDQTGNWDESSYDINDISGNFSALTYANIQASNSSTHERSEHVTVLAGCVALMASPM